MPKKKNSHASANAQEPMNISRIAIAGQGPILHRLAKIIFCREFHCAMPDVKLAALLLKDGQLLPEFEQPDLLKLPVYTSGQALFKKEKDLRLILDASTDGAYVCELRQHAPQGVNLLTPSAVAFICQAIEKDLLTLDGGARIRRMRHSFVTLIDQMEEDILIIDDEGKVAEVNAYFLKQRGGVREDYIGRHCRDIMGDAYCCSTGGEDICPWALPWRERTNQTKVYNVVNPEGQMEYYRVVVFPLPGESEEMRYSMFMRKNITDMLQMEQRLQQSQKMAAIGELSTYIAHEIRNPLFAIGGFANALLRSPSLDESAREKARVILEESQRLDGILKSIINFARPIEQDITDMDVGAVVRQTMQLMAIGDSERSISTVENIAENLPRARGNADFLKQAIINIIKNAQEAMPEGGTITVGAATRGHMLEISVQDTGIGISKEEQGKIFSPFYSTKGKGAGLGLAMTKKIIEDMGGQLQLESEPGKGTRVSLLLLPSLAVSNSELRMVSTPGQGTSITVKMPPGS